MTTNLIPPRRSLREIVEAATPPGWSFVEQGPGAFAWIPPDGLPALACPSCGDPITADDAVIDGQHAQCAEAGAEIGYKEAKDW